MCSALHVRAVVAAALLHAAPLASQQDLSLVKGSGDAVYVVVAGKAAWIPNPAVFDAMGMDWAAIVTTGDDLVGSLPKVPLLLKGSGPAVYIIENGSRRWIRSPAEFDGMGLDWSTIITIADGGLARIPEVTDGLPSPPLPSARPESRPLVYFTNPGVAEMDIYRVHGGGEEYFGSLAGGRTTPAIPAQVGDIWRFRLNASALADDRIRAEYVVTGGGSQTFELPGFLVNAPEPSQGAISQAAAFLSRNVLAAWDELGRAACGPGALAVGPTCLPALGLADVASLEAALLARATDLTGQYQREIAIVTNHLAQLGSPQDLVARTVTAVRAGDRDEVARAIGVDRLLAMLGSADTDDDGQTFDPAPDVAEVGGPSPGEEPYAFRAPPAASAARPESQASYTVTFSPILLDGSLGLGATYEAGMAWELRSDRAGRGPDASYEAWSWTAGASAGANYEVEIGIWFGGLDIVQGDAHGVTFGATVYAGGTLTFWWDYDGRLLGLTANPQVGFSAEAEYVRGTTRVN